jgi:hypothetical protein
MQKAACKTGPNRKTARAALRLCSPLCRVAGRAVRPRVRMLLLLAERSHPSKTSHRIYDKRVAPEGPAGLDQALLCDQAPWAFADSSTKLKRRSASNQSTSGDPTGHPGAVPDSALNSSSAPVGNVIFSFPRQVLNPTKSVVAGYQGVNCLKQSPRVSFDLLGGTVHGNECRATLRLRQVLIRVGSSVPKSRDNHLIRNPHNPSGSQ